jgi:hypothetical protein
MLIKSITSLGPWVFGSLGISVSPPLPPESVSSVLSVVNPSLRALCASVVNPASEPTPAQLGAWLLSATAALSIAALLKQFARKTPLEAEFLSRKEFTDFKTKVDQEFASLRDRIDGSFRSLADKLDAINNRLHDVRASVDRLDERTQTPHTWQPEIKHSLKLQRKTPSK